MDSTGLFALLQAQDLKVLVLSDKSEQTTRWVRSLLRLVKPFYRNIPTISIFLGSHIKLAAESGNITEQTSLQTIHYSLIEPYMLCFGVGVAQLLDSFIPSVIYVGSCAQYA